MFSRKKDDTLRCSFCGKSQDEVKKLIAGPSVHICNDCIDICNEIIADDRQASEPATADAPSAETKREDAPSVEWTSCPSCGVPLVLSLRIMQQNEIKTLPAKLPETKGEEI